mgnify:CR=1 FL=1
MFKNVLSLGFIQKIAVLYLVIWTVSPPLQLDTVYRIIALACAVIWVAIWFVRENPITLGKEQIGAIFFLIAVMVVVYFEKYDYTSDLICLCIFTGTGSEYVWSSWSIMQYLYLFCTTYFGRGTSIFYL